MGISKAQLARVKVVCKCGCSQEFMAFPVYRNGSLYTPEYKRGHHPNCRRYNFSEGFKPWNSGLRKETNPAVARQGQKGPDHWRYEAEQNPDWFAPDFDFRTYSARFGLKPRSKGGNKLYTKFRMAIMQRDKFTCLDCGMVADETEETDLLNVHHLVEVKKDKTKIFDPSNVVTLCLVCHRKRHRVKRTAAES